MSYHQPMALQPQKVNVMAVLRCTFSIVMLGLTITSCSVLAPSPVQPAAAIEPAPLPQDELPYSPEFEIQAATYDAGNVSIIVCFNIPTAEGDWILGRLPGDVYLSDTSQVVPLLSFHLVSLDAQSNSDFPRRCDRFDASPSVGFDRVRAVLTVERIAASMPSEVDWDQLLQRVDEAAADLVIEPMPDQEGPSFGVARTPPGMTDLEAHNLVVGLVEPVIIGPWVIPIDFDPE